jgi:hypothetical protein
MARRSGARDPHARCNASPALIECPHRICVDQLGNVVEARVRIAYPRRIALGRTPDAEVDVS